MASFGKKPELKPQISTKKEKTRGLTDVMQAPMVQAFAMQNVKGSGSEVHQSVGLQQAEVQTKGQLLRVEVKDNTESAWLHEWDGLSPLSTFSSDVKPQVVADEIVKILSAIQAKNILQLDFQRPNPFVFRGKTYEKHGDCEFQIAVFKKSKVLSKADAQCEVEIRRLSGYSFGFARFQDHILADLLGGHLVLRDRGDLGEAVPGPSAAKDTTDSKESGAELGGFHASPFSLDELELTDDGADFGDETESAAAPAKALSSAAETLEADFKEAEASSGAELLQRAMNEKSFLDDLRFDVQQLFEHAVEGDASKFAANACPQLPQLLNAMAQFALQCYDSWVVKMQLDVVEALVRKGCAYDKKTLFDALGEISERWSADVKNDIEEDEFFVFASSPTVVQACQRIRAGIQDQELQEAN